MKIKLADIGLVILALHWMLGYILRYNLEWLNDHNMNYFVTFCTGIGMALISLDFKQKEKRNWKKYAFYNIIALLGGVIVLIHFIDIWFEKIIFINKPIYVSVIGAIISLCIYFYRRKP